MEGLAAEANAAERISTNSRGRAVGAGAPRRGGERKNTVTWAKQRTKVSGNDMVRSGEHLLKEAAAVAPCCPALRRPAAPIHTPWQYTE